MGFVAQSQSAELVASRHDGCGRGMVTSGIAIIVAAPLVGSMPFCVELDNLKDTDAPIHQPAAMLVAAD